MSSSLQRLNRRRQRVEEAGRVAERPVRVELELEQVLAQEDHDLRPGQDPDVRRQPELERVTRGSSRSPKAWNVEIAVSV